MFTNLATGKKLVAGYEQFDVFTDMEFLSQSGIYLEAYKLFPHLTSQYPEALFILNTRNREAWIRSRLEHGKNLSYAHRSMLHYDLSSIHDLADRWRIEWERHHHQVMAFFARRSFRFLVCQIETDLPHLLHDALPECELSSTHYRVKGKRENRRVVVRTRLEVLRGNSEGLSECRLGTNKLLRRWPIRWSLQLQSSGISSNGRNSLPRPCLLKYPICGLMPALVVVIPGTSMAAVP